MTPSNRLATVNLDSEQAGFAFEYHYLILRGIKQEEGKGRRERRNLQTGRERN